MRTNKDCWFKNTLSYKYSIMLLVVCLAVGILLLPVISEGSRADGKVADFVTFMKALKARDDAKATLIGDSIFTGLEKKYKSDAGFRAYKSKLDAAEFLAKQMQQQLRKASNMRMLTVANEVFTDHSKDTRTLSIAPAKHFYKASLKLFSKLIEIDNLTNEERSFLAQYYNLKLRTLTSIIAKVGQALAIAEPSFKDTHDYVLVMPLLHASDNSSINVDVLPRWMKRSDQLDIFVDSCLLHFGFPFHAMNLAKKSAQLQDSSFSELDFYRSGAKKCGVSHPHIAVDCLKRAIDCAKNEEPSIVVDLQFGIIQLWLDTENYALAAGQAQKIFETYPNHKESGKAIWLYYYSLSRNNNTNEILVDIDKILEDNRCKVYKAKLLYIKWWALRRKRDQTARVAVLEYELLKQYGNDPMVAPILLSRATDLLAGQNYTGAYESLTKLIEKFPSTKAATQAMKMLAKLKSVKMAK